MRHENVIDLRDVFSPDTNEKDIQDVFVQFYPHALFWCLTI